MEMGREPKNSQVVTQDKSENPAICLIDENGVICKYEPREHVTHMSQPVDTGGEDPSEESSGALCVKERACCAKKSI